MKEANLKGYILHGFSCIVFWKRQNYEDSKKISGCWKLQRGRDEYAKSRGFLGQWKYSPWYYNSGYISIYNGPNPQDSQYWENVNYGLWVIMIYQYRFISCNKDTTLVVFPGGSDSKESAYNAGDLGLIPGSGKSPGKGNGNPFQCSCLGEIPWT